MCFWEVIFKICWKALGCLFWIPFWEGVQDRSGNTVGSILYLFGSHSWIHFSIVFKHFPFVGLPSVLLVSVPGGGRRPQEMQETLLMFALLVRSMFYHFWTISVVLGLRFVGARAALFLFHHSKRASLSNAKTGLRARVFGCIYPGSFTESSFLIQLEIS